MASNSDSIAKETKGERTSRRILDASEDLFAKYGYEGTSLRQIAEAAGIKEPGLYNHFAGKQALYEAVLFRALNPMAVALTEHMERADHLRDYTALPAVMTDLLLEHPQMAALFQQAMQGDKDALSNQLVGRWLDRLLQQGMDSLIGIGAPAPHDTTSAARETLAINLIAMFNLTTGYFLSQRAFDTLSNGDLTAPENIARQKRLLHKVIRAMLIS